jgi:predicted ArsR family transcriptional regulator
VTKFCQDSDGIYGIELTNVLASASMATVSHLHYTKNEESGPKVPRQSEFRPTRAMGMQNTKSEILVLLKRSGGSTVEELSSALGLARMTVRQHLATLGRDDLVTAREVRRPTGRPHFFYSLTDKGEEGFPKSYDRLADMILDEVALLEGSEIEGLSGTEKKSVLFRKLARRVAAQYAPRLEGKSLEERVAKVVEILDAESGLVEWSKTDGGYEILNYNCVYRRVAESQEEVCAWHRELIRLLLAGKARAVEFQSGGADRCRFTIEVDGALSEGEGSKEQGAS